VLSLTRADEEVVHKLQVEVPEFPPLKMRFNSQTLINFFKQRDQEMLNAFKGEKLTESNESKFSDLIASLTVQNGEEKDLDFDFSISEEGLFASSDKLMYTGSGNYDGNYFTFKGPISEAKV
jgi:hypothetical protein